MSIRFTRRRALAASLAASLPLVARPALAAPAGLTITDAAGRTVVLKAPAERIVLGFNFEEFTAATGVPSWDRVVGFGRALWAGWRPASFKRYTQVIPNLDMLPDVGNTEDGNYSVEKVISLRPDLVIMAQWSFSLLGPAVAQLEALGIPVMVVDYNAQDPGRHAASTIAMGIATGQEARGRELAATYLARVADIQARAAASPGKPKVYFELGQGGAEVVGNTYAKGMWGAILELLNAENIAVGRIPGAWGPLNPEYVLAANPDAVFIAGSSWVNRPNAVTTGFDADLALTRSRLAPYRDRKGWGDLTAIRNGQLFAVEHGLCRSLYDYTAMYYIGQQIHPDRFADIDPVAELRKYYESWLPVRFEGTWMAKAA